MAITCNTTLAELAAERDKLGITFLSIGRPRGSRANVACAIVDDAPLFFGHGSTVAEAIDEAFRLRREYLLMLASTKPA